MENRTDYYVYVHQLENDEVFYIEQGCKFRATSPYSRSIRWNEITSKQNYEVLIIKENLTLEDSLKLEKELILKYGRADLNAGTLINHNNGGQGLQGKDNHFYGKSFKGEDNGNFNNKYEKNPLSKPIYKLDFNGNIVQSFNSATEAEDKFGYITTCIINCCNKKRGTHYGFQFIRQKDYTEPKNHIYIPSKTSKQPVVSAIYKGDNKYEIVNYYNSSQEVSKDGFRPKCVSGCLNGTKKTHLSYYWFRVSDLTENTKKQLHNILNKI